MTDVQETTNFVDPKHPHERDGRDVPPVFDGDGRCLVCGCEWRDQEIARRDAIIDAFAQEVRRLDPDSPLLHENIEENDGWEREAHGHPEWIDDAYPSEPYVPGPEDHGIIRRLP